MTTAVLVAILSLLLGRMIRGDAAPRKFSVEFFGVFDTIVSFTAFTEDQREFDRCAGVVRGELERLHRLFDIYNEYDGLANVRTVNESAGRVPVKVDSSILDLIELAKTAYDDTGGAVNVALGPVLSIWHDTRERALDGDGGVRIPTYAELSAAAVHTNTADIEVDRERSTVFLRHPDMRLDVGAIAKGYAVQRAVDLVLDSGLRSGLINVGGNVAVIGAPMDGRDAWNIGVRASNGDESSKLLDVLYLSGGAAVTSGNDQRYFMSSGVRYHHIIDPKTLYPAGGVQSVTVLHPDSAAADILSTAAFIMPLEEARALVAKHKAEAVWVMEDGSKMATPGYMRLSKLGRDMSGRREGEAEQ
ncbi:MAG: FAD:protein FMN transferase [Synergistaceae bacterium]|jgi:thiamine biosynthesis lipoprotein|nr:FAD:protein FMN transferase [Synergistaceae bacterium]